MASHAIEATGRKRTNNEVEAKRSEKRSRNGENKNCISVIMATREDLIQFFQLLDDERIANFLQRDRCFKLVDKYLLAMVFVYLKRAKFKQQAKVFTRLNFFTALYLAHDMEEDEEEIKFEIFPWILGKNWRHEYKNFLHLRDRLWRSMEHRAVVSRRCCEQVFSLEPTHTVWRRERLSHHAGCFRSYDDNKCIEGLDSSSPVCQQCLLKYLPMGRIATSDDDDDDDDDDVDDEQKENMQSLCEEQKESQQQSKYSRLCLNSTYKRENQLSSYFCQKEE